MAKLHLVILALVCSNAAALRTTNKTVATTAAPTAADVQKLHQKLAVLAANLGGMLGAKDGTLAHAKVAPALQIFLKELNASLKETSSISDPAVAMKKLLDAKAGIASLTSELTMRQESLMKEDESQRESLLLGVLMTKQSEPMDKQLQILNSDDFSKLEVSKSLLAKHDPKTPLFTQAATYLDKHHGSNEGSHAASVVSKRQSIIASLEKREQALEEEYKQHAQRHGKVVEGLNKRMKTASKAELHTIEQLKKREERQFKKWAATRQHDIKTMKMALDAVKTGDMKELNRARSALEDSLKALQSSNGGFLVLLQQGHQLMERDCPYCAAQCVDKCHQEGNPYVQCMTTCADAGK